MIIDAFMWSYEADAVDVRLREYAGLVDLHVAVQGTTTLRYEPRETPEIQHPNVINVMTQIPPGLTPFEAEEFLRDRCLKAAIAHSEAFTPSTRVMISDGDEIPHPDAITEAVRFGRLMSLRTDYREWFMDWRAPDAWQLERQPFIGTAEQILMRGGASRTRVDTIHLPKTRAVGWHLSTCGNAAHASRKLSTFSHPEVDTPEHNDLTWLDTARMKGRDLLDRFDLIPTDDLPACAGEFPHLLSSSLVPD